MHNLLVVEVKRRKADVKGDLTKTTRYWFSPTLLYRFGAVVVINNRRHRIFDQDPTPVGDPATYFFYHAGHPSTAAHRIVGKKLFEEIAAHPPAAR